MNEPAAPHRTKHNPAPLHTPVGNLSSHAVRAQGGHWVGGQVCVDQTGRNIHV